MQSRESDVFNLFSEIYSSADAGGDEPAAISPRLPRQPGHVCHCAGAHGGRDRRTDADRHQRRRAPRPHLPQPHNQDLSGLRRFLRHGRHDRADRRLFPLCRAGAGGAQADPLSARAGRRRQVLARRAAEEADGEAADLHAEGRRPDQPGLRIAARPVPSRAHGRPARGEIRHCPPPAHGPDLALGVQAARRARRRHLEIQRGAS